MRPRGIRLQLKIAGENVQKEIAVNASHSRISAGLSSEGYAGGYQQALRDVSLALDGTEIYHSRYWPEP